MSAENNVEELKIFTRQSVDSVFMNFGTKNIYKKQIKWSRRSEKNLHRLYEVVDPDEPVDPLIQKLTKLKPVKFTGPLPVEKRYLIDINLSKLRDFALSQYSKDIAHTVFYWSGLLSDSGTYYIIINKDKLIEFLKALVVNGEQVAKDSEKIQIEHIQDDISIHFESYQREIVDLRNANYKKQGVLALSKLKPRYNKYIIDEAKLAIYKHIHDERRVLIEKAMTTGVGKTTEQINYQCCAMNGVPYGYKLKNRREHRVDNKILERKTNTGRDLITPDEFKYIDGKESLAAKQWATDNFANWERCNCWLCGLPLWWDKSAMPQGEHKIQLAFMACFGVGPATKLILGRIKDSNEPAKAYEKSIISRDSWSVIRRTLIPDSLFINWKKTTRGEGYAWAHAWCNLRKNAYSYVKLGLDENNNLVYYINYSGVVRFASEIAESFEKKGSKYVGTVPYKGNNKNDFGHVMIALAAQANIQTPGRDRYRMWGGEFVYDNIVKQLETLVTLLNRSFPDINGFPLSPQMKIRHNLHINFKRLNTIFKTYKAKKYEGFKHVGNTSNTLSNFFTNIMDVGNDTNKYVNTLFKTKYQKRLIDDTFKQIGTGAGAGGGGSNSKKVVPSTEITEDSIYDELKKIENTKEAFDKFTQDKSIKECLLEDDMVDFYNVLYGDMFDINIQNPDDQELGNANGMLIDNLGLKEEEEFFPQDGENELGNIFKEEFILDNPADVQLIEELYNGKDSTPLGRQFKEWITKSDYAEVFGEEQDEKKTKQCEDFISALISEYELDIIEKIVNSKLGFGKGGTDAEKVQTLMESLKESETNPDIFHMLKKLKEEKIIDDDEYNEQYQINQDRFSWDRISPVEIQPRDENGNPEWPARLVNVVHWAREREESGKGLVDRGWGPVEHRKYIRWDRWKAHIIACRINKQLPLVEWKYERPEMTKFLKEQFQEKQQERNQRVLQNIRDREKLNAKELARMAEEEDEKRKVDESKRNAKSVFKDVQLLKDGSRYNSRIGGVRHAYWRNVRLQQWREMKYYDDLQMGMSYTDPFPDNLLGMLDASTQQNAVETLSGIAPAMTSGQRDFPKVPFPPIPLNRSMSAPAELDTTKTPPRKGEYATLSTENVQGTNLFGTPGDSTKEATYNPVTGTYETSSKEPGAPKKKRHRTYPSHYEEPYPKFYKGDDKGDDKEGGKEGGKKKKRNKRTKRRKRKKKKTRKSKRKKRRTKKRRRKRKKRTRRRR